MAKVTVHYDKGTDTLVVWWGDKHREVVCDHTDSDVIVMLDEDGLPLGVEVLEYHPEGDALTVDLTQSDTSVPRIRASA